MIQITDLDFDSTLFGYRVGKIVIDGVDIDMEEFAVAAKKHRLVYIFSRQKLAGIGLPVVDEKVTLATTPAAGNTVPGSVMQYEPERHNFDQLHALTLQSGIYSRFNIDPYFTNGEYGKLYDLWLSRSIDGNSAFEIDVVTEYDELAGFITIGQSNKTMANIGLLAVSDKFRGKGYGVALVQKAIDTSLNNGYQELEVVTQMQNAPALNLYQKMGFKIKNVTNIYHYWNL